MATIYTCELTTTYTFTLKADSYEEAMLWLQTHDHAEVKEATSCYDVDFSEDIIGEDEETEAAIDISTEEE